MGVVEDGKAAAVAFEEAVTKSRKALRAGCEYRWGDRTQFETYWLKQLPRIGCWHIPAEPSFRRALECRTL